MSDRIKIVIERHPIEPDPPPFICDVCVEEHPYWHLSHNGQKKVCFEHYRGRTILPSVVRYSMDFHDSRQTSVISNIIQEIKDECHRRKGSAH